MDDFGTGYASLSQLARFPFDKIKIDRSLAGFEGENNKQRAIVRAITALGEALDGSGKPLVSTSALLTLGYGRLGRTATEDDALPGGPRIDAENAVIALAERGIRSSVVRVPPITHNDRIRQGFAQVLVDIARATGVAGHPGDGTNRWPAGHTLDVAHLYCLALTDAPAGTRLHAAAEPGIPLRDIAEVIGQRLDLPVVSIPADEVAAHFRHLAQFVVLDCPVDATRTRELLGWQPSHPTLFEDYRHGRYFDQRPLPSHAR